MIPQKHVLNARHTETYRKLSKWTSQVTQMLYPRQDVNFEVNQDIYVKQTVGHLYIHIIPRKRNDELP